MDLTPLDKFNQELIDQAHPADWQNPTPTGKYNLVAVGGGTAGIISALGTAGLGGKAALIERHLLGGDCLNYGCVPSKALIRAARAAYQVATAEQFGRAASNGQVDFAAVMQRMRRLRAQISHHDSAARFSDLGVDVYLGTAKFTGPTTLEVQGQKLEFSRAVIATGGHAAVPNIKGLDEVGYLTNETVFSLTELPQRLVVIGGGPIGCELAQAFRRFGSDVHLVQRSESVLTKDDPRAAQIVQRQLEREGIHLHLGWTTERAEKSGETISLVISRSGEQQSLTTDRILVAVGRRPNVEGLGLESAGVEFTERGIHCNDRLQTSNRRVFAAGDVAGRQLFTHAADAMARLCIQNALFYGRKKASSLVIPHCTYTDPEIAHVGLTPAEAREAGVEIDSYECPLSDVDRAILDGEEDGWAVVHTRRGSGTVVGATIVAAHAGDLINEVTLLMTSKLSLGSLANTIHPYPTQAEVLKRIADNYSRTRLTPLVAKLFRSWLSLGR